jgi:dienelactone hydrolase
MKFAALFACTCFFLVPRVNRLNSQALLSQKQEKLQLPPGKIIESVLCEGDPAESYALYLPSIYTTAMRWPIIYAFDPEADGKTPVELYKDIAEKYGFVIAGSNNSRNFSNNESSKSMSAMWRDTHSRLALDEHRIYTTGFSGGARMAGAMAMSCKPCQIAGVIAHGAGYPSLHKPGGDGMLYFFAVGDRDFNWPEVIAIRREREEQGARYRVRVYPGRHQWAPAEIMEDAMEWMTLSSMRLGTATPDAAFIDRFFQQTQGEAHDAEEGHDSIAQLSAYRSLVSDFSRLKDVAEYEKKLASLKKSAELKSALKKEQQQIADQSAIESEISPQFRLFADGSTQDPRELESKILQEMSLLKSQREHAKSAVQRLVSERAFSGLWAEGIENGQMEFESHHFDKAEACFRLMSGVGDSPWPVLLLAETHVAQGKKKQAIKDLCEAVRRGLKDPKIIENDDKLRGLTSDPEFEKILAELKRSQPG